MPTDRQWIDAARSRLLGLRCGDGAWGYRPGSAPAVEPSSLAALALLGSEPPTRRSGPDATTRRTGEWIARSARRPDGSTVVTLDAGADLPGWTTPFALLLWGALGGFAPDRRQAVGWLLATRGEAHQPEPNNPMGHDVTLVGWPWVVGTHSWVEPTATALLALAPAVPLDHPRLLEGVRVLLDRAIPTGGWNLGNPLVFGQTLRPLPGPTGLALVALARVARSASPTIVRAALDYLKRVVEQTSAPASLGWAVLGLRAWDADSPRAMDRLPAAIHRALGRDASAGELAVLLLAAGDRSLAVLGLTPPTPSEPPR